MCLDPALPLSWTRSVAPGAISLESYPTSSWLIACRSGAALAGLPAASTRQQPPRYCSYPNGSCAEACCSWRAGSWWPPHWRRRRRSAGHQLAGLLSRAIVAAGSPRAARAGGSVAAGYVREPVLRSRPRPTLGSRSSGSHPRTGSLVCGLWRSVLGGSSGSNVQRRTPRLADAAAAGGAVAGAGRATNGGGRRV